MCVKLPLGNLNPGSCPLHPINTYTCGVTNTPRVRGGDKSKQLIVPMFCSFQYYNLRSQCSEWFNQ